MSEKRYVEVDIEKLAEVLAEEDWLKTTKSVRTDDLWEVTAMLDPNGNSVEIVRTVRSYWATSFFAWKRGYEELIMHYSKPTGNDNQTPPKEGP